MGDIVTVIVMDDVLQHTTVTCGAVGITVTKDIMGKTPQRKNIHYTDFLWLKIVKPLTRVIVNSPQRQGPKGIYYTTDIWTSDRHTSVLTDTWMPNTKST